MSITYLDPPNQSDGNDKITYLDDGGATPSAPPPANISSPSSVSDMAWDALGRFGKGAYQATNFLPGLLSTKNPLADKMYSAIPPANNIGQLIPETLGSVAPTLAFSAPYIAAARAAGLNSLLANAVGYGGFSGTKSALQGNSLGQTSLNAAQGAGTGLLSSFLGAQGQNVTSGGANLLSKIIGNATGSAPKLISPLAVKTLGTALGSSAGGAASTAITGGTPQDILNNAVVQGGLGALNPSKVISQDEYNDQISKNAVAYRELLHPTASVIKKVEGGFTNNDIDNSYAIMAKLGVPIAENNGTFDTRPGQQVISNAIQPLVQAKNQMLATNQSPQFNLNDIRTQALSQLNKNTNLDSVSLASAAKDINTHINAAISDPRGPGMDLNGQQADNLKSQLYGVGYTDLAPTSEIAAKQIASVIKNNIEKSYPTMPIQQTNDTIGKYAAAQNLLAIAHGTKVSPPKNALPAAMIGAGAGALISAGTNLVGVGNPIVNSALTPLGAAAGTGVNDLIQRAHNNPEMLTKLLKSKLESLTVR